MATPLTSARWLASAWVTAPVPKVVKAFSVLFVELALQRTPAEVG